MELIKTVEWTPQGVVIRKSWTNSTELAKYMNLDEHEVEWALEEYGRCDSIEGVTAWVAYDPTEQWPHDPFAEGEPDEYQPADTQEKVKAGANFPRREKE